MRGGKESENTKQKKNKTSIFHLFIMSDIAEGICNIIYY